MPVPDKAEIETGSDSLQELHPALDGQKVYDTVIAYQEDSASNGHPADLVFGIDDTDRAVTVPPNGQVTLYNVNTQKAIQCINTDSGNNFSSLHVSVQAS